MGTQGGTILQVEMQTAPDTLADKWREECMGWGRGSSEAKRVRARRGEGAGLHGMTEEAPTHTG